jgi:hypothetical protein
LQQTYREELTGTREGYSSGKCLNAIYMHEHLIFFKFVRGCNTAVPILNINLIINMSKHYFYFIKGIHGWKQAPGSFIFALRNKENLPPFKAPLKDQDDPYAISARTRAGPIFGKRHDIHIYSDAGSNTNSHTNFNQSYQAPSGVSDASTILAGTQYFQPSEIEVLHIV